MSRTRDRSRRRPRRQRQDPHGRPRPASRPGPRHPRRDRLQSGRTMRCGVLRPRHAGHRRRRPTDRSGLQRRARAPHRRRRGARRRRSPAVAGRGRPGAACRTLREHAAGGRVDHRRLLGSRGVAGKALPTRELIDAVTPDHPVFVKRLDGHMALANSLAMRLAGVATMSRSRRAARSSATRAAGSPESSRTPRWTS